MRSVTALISYTYCVRDRSLTSVWSSVLICLSDYGSCIPPYLIHGSVVVSGSRDPEVPPSLVSVGTQSPFCWSPSLADFTRHSHLPQNRLPLRPSPVKIVDVLVPVLTPSPTPNPSYVSDQADFTFYTHPLITSISDPFCHPRYNTSRNLRDHPRYVDWHLLLPLYFLQLDLSEHGAVKDKRT